jgi:ferrous-iron efflux pump FieF
MSDKHFSLNLSAGFASVAVAMALVLMKLWAFSETGALSIAASLADSAMDMMVSGLGLFAIFYAARPADDDHAFGHSSVEDLISLAQALFIALSASAIGLAAIKRLLTPSAPALQAHQSGITVMIASIMLTGALVAWQRHVAKRTRNKVIAADSLHYVGDLMPALGAILALGLSARFDITWVDSVIALIGVAVMLGGAMKIGIASWHALMDRQADTEIIRGIETIALNWPGVHGFHDLKTRTAGSKVFVHLHIELDGDQTLREAHEIGAALKAAIRLAYPQTDVIIHKDVADL